MSTLTKEIQDSISPNKAVEMLKEGNQRFLDKNVQDRDLHIQVQNTSDGQFPYAVVLLYRLKSSSRISF